MRYSTDSIAQIQQEIDEHIQALGGYWRPLSTLARLLEEIGELAEVLNEQKIDHQKLGLELADIFVITICLANQYHIELRTEYAALKFPSNLNHSNGLMNIAIRAGMIARILNGIAGDKKPKENETQPTLNSAIAYLHVAVFELAEQYQIHLPTYVQNVLAKSRERDKNRFQKIS